MNGADNSDLSVYWIVTQQALRYPLGTHNLNKPHSNLRRDKWDPEKMVLGEAWRSDIKFLGSSKDQLSLEMIHMDSFIDK